MDSPQLDPSLLAPLLDAVDLFTRLRIPYALVGGLAAMVYGRARFTEDVDFVAAQGHENALAANPEVMRACHFDPGCTWKLYHESGAQIDLWKDPFSSDIAARAVEIPLAGHAVRVAEVHDLIAMKLRAGRLQDDYDIGEMVRARAVDESILRDLATEEEFSKYAEIRDRANHK